eukprot:Opistho-2@22075
MVIEKVVLVIIGQACSGNAGLHEQADIGALSVCGHFGGIDWRKKLSHIRHDRARGIIASKLNALRPEHAKIRLHHNVVVGSVALVRVVEAVATDAAEFLGGPHHKANGALGTETKLLDGKERRPRNESAATIIHRTLADIPAVHVAAEQNNLLGVFRSGNVCNHIPRLCIRESACLHFELHNNALSALLHACKHLCILNRDACDGDLRHSVLVRLRAGVRTVDREGGDSPDKGSHRAHLPRSHGTAHAIRHSHTVRNKLGVEHNNLPLCLRSARSKIVKGRHDKHLCGYALGRSCNAAPKTKKGEAVHAGLKETERLKPALPMGHHHFLAVHIVESIRLQLRKRVVDRSLESGCPGETRSKCVDKHRQTVVCNSLSFARSHMIDNLLCIILVRSHFSCPTIKRRRSPCNVECGSEGNQCRKSQLHDGVGSCAQTHPLARSLPLYL